jgi:hypothetical protein
MKQRFKPQERSTLAETWEDQALRQAFYRWKREVKPPPGAWESILKEVRQVKPSAGSQTATSKQS